MLEKLRSIGTRAAPKDGLDLLLIMCPPWDITRPPINIAYLSSFAKAHGIRTDAWDLNIKFYNAVIETPLKDLWEMMSQNTVSPPEMTERFFAEAPELVDDFVQRIVDAGAKYIGFSLHYRNVIFTERMVEMIRQRDKKRVILYGGPEVAADYKIGALAGLSADAYVVGEGEKTMVEAIRHHQEKKRFAPIPGLIVNKGKELTEFEPRKPIMELDQLPFPSYEEFDLAEYHPEENNVNLPFLYSRGCIGKCTFCMDHYIAGKHRCRSPENAVAEIKHHMETYGITHFGFNDLICNGNPRALERLCDLIIEENLNILWWSYAVMRKGLTPTLFKKMRASGCVSINFGMESASDKVLKAMNKYFTQDIAEDIVRNCARAGIQTAINIIVGFPGETRKEHQETLDFLKRNKDYIHSVVNVGTLMLSPGTQISMFPENYGIKIDEQRGTWYTDDGNTIEERNRRLEEVRQLLHQLNIPLVIINRELCAGESPVDEYVNAEPAAVEPNVKLYDMKFFNGLDQECDGFRTGDTMTLAIRYLVEKPVDDPMIRVQIYNDENPNGDNVFVYGMNTDRFNVHLGPLDKGRGEARLIFYQLNLLPGTYRVTVGLWPDELAVSPFDVWHGTHEFRIEGETDDTGAKAYIPHRWVQRDALGESQNGAGSLQDILLVDRDGVSKPCFTTQETLRARIGYDLAEPERFALEAQILLKGGSVHRVERDEPLPAGRNVVELTYTPINLLEGAYETLVRLVDKESGEVASTQRAYFDIRSRRIDGAGLVFNPCAWNIIKTPRRDV